MADFRDIVGQEHLKEQLQKKIAEGFHIAVGVDDAGRHIVDGNAINVAFCFLQGCGQRGIRFRRMDMRNRTW